MREGATILAVIVSFSVGFWMGVGFSFGFWMGVG